MLITNSVGSVTLNTGTNTIGSVKITDGTNTASVVGTALKIDGSSVTQPVSGTVTVTQGTASNLNAAVVGIGTAGSPSGGVISIQGVSSGTAVTIGNNTIIDAGNTTTTLLGANATFTGTARDLLGYTQVSVFVYSNVASATGGLNLQFSTDGTNWDEDQAVTISAANAQHVSVSVIARYFRIVYTNGGTAQTTFRLQTILKSLSSSGSIGNIETLPVIGDTTLRTQSLIVGKSSAGGGAYVDVKVNPSGSLVADVTGSTVGLVAGTASIGTVGLNAGANTIGSVNQAGTWIVQPGNTANTTPWLTTINQGGNSATVKGSSSTPTTSDAALTVSLSPNSSPINDRTATGSVTSLGGSVSISTQGYSTVTAQILGTWTGFFALQGTNDGTNWININSLVNSPTNTVVVSTSSNGTFTIPCAGYQSIRVISIFVFSGTANISLEASVGSCPIINTIPADRVLSTQNLTGTLSASISTQGSGTVTIFTSNTWTGTIYFEVTNDSLNWSLIQATSILGVSSTSATSNNTWKASCSGWGQFRVRANLSSGTVSVALQASQASSNAVILQEGTSNIGSVYLNAGANTIGSVNQAGTWTTTVTQATASNLKAQITGSGSAGTADAGVVTIQGIAGMTAVKVDGSAVTQPVSGTVTANAGTGSFTVAQATAANLNATVTGTITANIGTSGSLALDATLTGGTQRTKITDGTNNAAVKPASTSALATDPALVVALHPSNPVPSGTNTIGNIKIIDTGGSTVATVKAGSTGAAYSDTALVVATRPSGTVISGVVTLSTTTATQFNSNLSSTIGVWVSAPLNNTASIYIGSNSVTSGQTGNGIELMPGDREFFPVVNLNVLYAITATTTQYVHYMVL